MEPGENNVIIVAHPDDETLWCGGLPIRYSDKKWTAICCTLPRADPIRSEKFKEACRILGMTPIQLEIPEQDFSFAASQAYLETGVVLDEYDCIVTHGPSGEYGHQHHRSVHDFVISNYITKDILTFSYEQDNSDMTIRLSPQEFAQKLQALKCYDHTSPFDRKPKWEALIDRYFPAGGLDREDYCWK